MGKINRKFITTSCMLWMLGVWELFSHHKEGHGGGGGNGGAGNGNGNGNTVPEIDGNELQLAICVLFLIYLMYFYWRRNLANQMN